MMRCPTLTELPPPPPGKIGWPWTEESEQLPDTMPAQSEVEGLDGSSWPKVSIVTPSYNQAQFLEETIRSVLLQGYPNLEYIIIDGGSTDGSVDIIRKYEPWLAYWVSEPDRGQSHAINKGWKSASGEVLAWLNSDDIYGCGAIGQAMRLMSHPPESDLVYSECEFIDTNGNTLYRSNYGPYDQAELVKRDVIPQPTAFVKTEMIFTVGLLNEAFHYAMDYDLWLRVSMSGRVKKSDGIWAKVRYHEACKSRAHTDSFAPEVLKMYHSFFAKENLPSEISSLSNQCLRRTNWRIAKALYMKGQPEDAEPYARRSMELGLSNSDLHYGIQYLIHKNDSDDMKPSLVNHDWLSNVCKRIAGFDTHGRYFSQRIMQAYLKAAAFQCYQERSFRSACQFAIKAFTNDANAVTNIGLWKLFIKSLAKTVTGKVR
jgi:glycosyltransferase involved in cell wall biosynthesis